MKIFIEITILFHTQFGFVQDKEIVSEKNAIDGARTDV